jgi:hypothetical protein
MNRVTFTVIGYLLFLTGFVALILGLIGLSLQPLVFLDNYVGPLGSLFVKLLMVVLGMIIFYVSRVPIDEE